MAWTPKQRQVRKVHAAVDKLLYVENCAEIHYKKFSKNFRRLSVEQKGSIFHFGSSVCYLHEDMS